MLSATIFVWRFKKIVKLQTYVLTSNIDLKVTNIGFNNSLIGFRIFIIGFKIVNIKLVRVSLRT